MAEERVAPAASPVSVLVAEAQDHTAARPSFFESLVRFCITGLSSVGADFALLFGLHHGAGVSLPVSVTIGYLGALVVNYTLNRNWSFQATASHGHTLVRYLAVAAFNYGSTLLIVLGLNHAGLNYLVSKLIAVAANAGTNFLAARYWVFKH